ncbi:MAG: ribosome silencing factor [Coriobacteriia bacterium]|nr:ribosome silencing factor [Coriobacteriia bacterium]
MTDRKRAIELNSKDYALLAAEAASDKKAADIVAIDVAELLVVTDYFVICTGNNDRQVRTIGDEVEIRLKQAGLPAIGVEGREEGKWLLLDFADVVVHVFQPAERDFYRLEKLWGEAQALELPESVTGSVVVAPADVSELAEEPEPAEAGA